MRDLNFGPALESGSVLTRRIIHPIVEVGSVALRSPQIDFHLAVGLAE